MRQNPHVRICGGLGSATALVYPTLMPCRRSRSATGTPDSASLRIPTTWLSVNFDFRMTAPLSREQSTFECLPRGEAYGSKRTSGRRLNFYSLPRQLREGDIRIERYPPGLTTVWANRAGAAQRLTTVMRRVTVSTSRTLGSPDCSTASAGDGRQLGPVVRKLRHRVRKPSFLQYALVCKAWPGLGAG